MTDGALRATGLKVHFEGVRAVDDVDVTLDSYEILGLIGPNGAGKTTLLNALSGFVKLTAGKIQIGGRDATRWSPHRRSRHGLARTFQNVRLFGELSAFENVEAAAVTTGGRRRDARKWTAEVLERMGLDARADAPAASLPYGEERLLGVARALATRPRFLLLDEPAAGLNEVESDALATSLREIRDGFGCGLLVIEHDMRMIMSVCDRIQVLEYGKTICNGTPAEVRSDPAVVAAYLGTEEGAASAQA
jgi:branched-chain amino acid transport system ATP-binding protein